MTERKHMNLQDFAKEVHQNAVDHGWWETDRPVTECIALIHSEWSEALEEARAGRPMVYIVNGEEIVEIQEFGDVTGIVSHKPEGIAVELIDGVIRILDLFGKLGYKFMFPDSADCARKIKQQNPRLNRRVTPADIVAAVHSLTSAAYDIMFRDMTPQHYLAPLEVGIGLVFCWLELQGQEPEKIMQIKHEYNKTRPYKHGKKF